MSVAPWSIDGALQGLLDGCCPQLVTQQDLDELREKTAAKKGSEIGFSDTLLLTIINREIVSSIGTATYVDEYDDDHLEMQDRFKRAYDELLSVINSLSEPLKSSVSLPADYKIKIDNNRLLNYAIKRPVGHPSEDRKYEFFINLMALYQMITGQKPGGGETGPTVRFFKAIVDHLQRCLESATDRHGKFYAQVADLWWLPASRTFLKDWARNNGGIKALSSRIDDIVRLHLEACARMHARAIGDEGERGQVFPFPGEAARRPQV
jgi:hypothetical protein